MSLAMERKELKDNVTGAILGMRKPGADDDTIIKAVMEMFTITKEYVITPKPNPR